MSEQAAVVEVLQQQVRGLAMLVNQMKKLIQYSAPASPDYRAGLQEFKAFDWPSIGAEVLHEDQSGPVAVRWNRHDFVRRVGDGKFGKAVWFSRCLGKEGGENVYARLISFKGDGTYEAEPITFEL